QPGCVATPQQCVSPCGCARPDPSPEGKDLPSISLLALLQARGRSDIPTLLTPPKRQHLSARSLVGCRVPWGVRPRSRADEASQSSLVPDRSTERLNQAEYRAERRAHGRRRPHRSALEHALVSSTRGRAAWIRGHAKALSGAPICRGLANFDNGIPDPSR